jgi:Tfp pilus assembly protein PilW
MRQKSEEGFTIIELLIATGVLLVVMSSALLFFSRSQSIYTNERQTLNMVQDLRTAFDRFTNEIRMAGAGLPGYRGVISGKGDTLIVRGDFNDTSTIVTSTGTISAGNFPVGSTTGFVAGQTISMLDTDGTSAGSSGFATISMVDEVNGAITIDTASFLPLTSGSQLSDFGPGCLINVIERRTYTVVNTGANLGNIMRTTAFEDTQNVGATIEAAEIIASNVIDPSGKAGLSFTYLKADDGPADIDPDTGYVTPTQVAKVRITLNARTAHLDLASGQYRTLNLTALIQVRGQYIPGVGF